MGIPYGSDPSMCPVRATTGWMAAAGLTAGPLFRSRGIINRQDQPLPCPWARGAVDEQALQGRSIHLPIRQRRVHAGPAALKARGLGQVDQRARCQIGQQRVTQIAQCPPGTRKAGRQCLTIDAQRAKLPRVPPSGLNTWRIPDGSGPTVVGPLLGLHSLPP